MISPLVKKGSVQRRQYKHENIRLNKLLCLASGAFIRRHNHRQEKVTHRNEECEEHSIYDEKDRRGSIIVAR